ncbi:hypothetical protein BpHYR1_041550 [Brachionus plicatilis]|uniref:Uncharacterized protein n=1 Tax=Brachionus plicatilis TaxID=10195 RepID=A0A3M7QG65_BRAPC|nr:hypothetical protein BpHYR1_041550 [Brachionus plicatilis]
METGKRELINFPVTSTKMSLLLSRSLESFSIFILDKTVTFTVFLDTITTVGAIFSFQLSERK